MNQQYSNALPEIILYFQVHQPRRLAKMKFTDIGKRQNIFDDTLNKEIITRISQNCYLPTNDLLRAALKKYPKLKVCFSLSGILIDQLEEYQPAVLASFRDLALSGSVEFLGETYYHSLSSVLPNNEFIKQVEEHRELLQRHFGVRPSVFRNTDLIYSTSIASKVAQLGFKGMLCDGSEHILHNQSAHKVYRHPTNSNFNVLFRNNTLSDDISFRFTQDGGLDAKKYLQKLYNVPGDSVILLGVNYETFGEHYSTASGISEFLEKLITNLNNDWEVRFATPSDVISDVINDKKPTETFDVKDFVSWVDTSNDISAWLGTEIQREAFNALNSLEDRVIATQNPELIKMWRTLQSSDHFYYMSDKSSTEGHTRPNFSHYSSPYEAFINYMNVLSDFTSRLEDGQVNKNNTTENNNNTEHQRRQEEVPVWAQQYAADVANTIG